MRLVLRSVLCLVAGGAVLVTAVSPAARAEGAAETAGEDTIETARAPKLESLVAALSSADSHKIRLQAAVLLGRSGDPRALQPLADAVDKDPHFTVRAAAAVALGALGDGRAASHLLTRMGLDDETFVREEASRALEKLERPAVLPIAVATCSSPDPDVRKQAVGYVLAELTPMVEPVLAKALGDIPEIAAVAQAALATVPPATRLRILAEGIDHREPAVRRGALRALASLANAEAARLVLRVYDRDVEEEEVRIAAREALRELQSHLPLLHILRDATSAAEKHARARALRLLGAVGGAEAEHALLAALGDSDRYIRGIAVMALGELGDPAALPSLEKLAADPENARILHLVNNTLRQLRAKRAAP